MDPRHSHKCGKAATVGTVIPRGWSYVGRGGLEIALRTSLRSINQTIERHATANAAAGAVQCAVVAANKLYAV